MLGLPVRIPPHAWMSLVIVVYVEVWVGLIIRLEDFYRVWCFCAWSWSFDNEEAVAPWRGKKHGWKPWTLDVTSCGIMRKVSIDNEGRRSVSEDTAFQTEALVCTFQLNETHLLKMVHITADEFSLFGKIYSSQFGLYKQYVLLWLTGTYLPNCFHIMHIILNFITSRLVISELKHATGRRNKHGVQLCYAFYVSSPNNANC